MVYTIIPEKILNYSPEEPIAKIISSTNVWFFPVISAGETRTLLTVDFIGGEWKSVAIGASGLAKQWASIMEVWPPSNGYEHTFIRVFQAKSDFVLLSGPDKTKLVPLKSALLSLGLAKEEESKNSDIILRLQSSVMSNIESFKSFDK